MGKIKGYDHFFDDGKSYYDENGNKIDAYKNFFDDGVSYYKDGQKIGSSYKNFFDDGVSTYDKNGQKVSSTYKNFFDDGYSTYNTSGQKISSTYDNFFDGGTTTYTYGNDSYGSGISGYGGGYSDLYGSTDPYGLSGYSGYSGYVGGGYGSAYRSPSVDPFTGICYNRSSTARDNLREGCRKARLVIGILQAVAAVYCIAYVIFRGAVPFDQQIYVWGTMLLTALFCFTPGLQGLTLIGPYLLGIVFAAVQPFLAVISVPSGLGYWQSYPGMLFRYLRLASVASVAGLLAGYLVTLFINRKVYKTVTPNSEEKAARPVAALFMVMQLLILWSLCGYLFNIRIYLYLALAAAVIYTFFVGNMEGAGPLYYVGCGFAFGVLLIFGFLAEGNVTWDAFKYFVFQTCGIPYGLTAAALLFVALVAGGTKKNGFSTIIGVMWLFACVAAALPLLWSRFGFLRERSPLLAVVICFAMLFILHLSVCIHYDSYKFGRTLWAFVLGAVCLLIEFVRFYRYYGLRNYFLGKTFLIKAGALVALLLISAIPAMVKKSKKKKK